MANAQAAFAIEPSQPIATSAKTAASTAPTVHEPVVEAESAAGPCKKRRRSSAASEAKAVAKSPIKEIDQPDTMVIEDDENEEGEGEDDEELVHESLKPTSKRQRQKKTQKYVPEAESQEDRDRRTIFVGNLSLEVAKSKVRPPLPTIMS